MPTIQESKLKEIRVPQFIIVWRTTWAVESRLIKEDRPEYGRWMWREYESCGDEVENDMGVDSNQSLCYTSSDFQKSV